jgi:DNA-binding transcriptional ArsR family regulator
MLALRPSNVFRDDLGRPLTTHVALCYRRLTMKPATQDRCCPPANERADLRPIEGDEADEELANMSKALGHPARVKIIRILVRKNACICGDIVEELPLAQSTVSQHLKVLKDAGIVRGDVDGPRVCYCIEPRALRRLKALVGGL